MKLEEIGFYTLCDSRAYNASTTSPLWRCELLLTDSCNFRCPYCRGLRKDMAGSLPFEQAKYTVDLWCRDKLKNIRFSGGEPTMYEGLIELVKLARFGGVERIALSTNGSADFTEYEELIKAGVNDFSISLDGCCASVGDSMSGGIKGSWDRVVESIKRISERTYCSVGMVFTEENIDGCVESVKFADSLGVADIRVIPSAQYNKALLLLSKLDDSILSRHKILKYRIDNIKAGRHVRGITESDRHKCWLALDDMAVVQGYHFPCIIHLREGGDPIGKVCPTMREDRFMWIKRHDPYLDPICRKNCLDVCIDYNKKASETHS